MSNESSLSSIVAWWNSSGTESLEDALRLSRENDDDNDKGEPYKGKYASRKKLEELRDRVQSSVISCVEEDPVDSLNESSYSWGKLHVSLLEIALRYLIAVNHSECEELSTSLSLLKVCCSDLQRFSRHRCGVSLAMLSAQHVATVFCQLGNYSSALDYLTEADSMYSHARNSERWPPLHWRELFGRVALADEQRAKEFESVHTHTVYYLAQVYAKLDQPDKAASFYQMTLCRHLESGDGKPLELSTMFMNLGRLYLNRDNFAMSRYCLTCASRLLDHANSLSCCEKDGEDNNSIVKAETELSACWAQYGVDLLEFSSKVLQQKDLQIDNTISMDSSLQPDLLKNLQPPVCCDPVKSYPEALEVSLFSQRHLNKLKLVFLFEEHCVDHIKFIQQHSTVFRHLSKFEAGPDRVCKLLKKRYDMLRLVVNELNPQYYLHLQQEMYFELGEICEDMAQQKRMQIEQNKNLNDISHLRKINAYLLDGVRYFQKFVDSVVLPGKEDQPFPQHLTRAALLAHFHIASLHGCRISASAEERVHNLELSSHHFHKCVDYCAKYPEAAVLFSEELPLCQEKVNLLPYQIAKERTRH